MPYTLHVVSHTHWDREWYQPFESFRLRLVRLIDNLLAILDSDPSFRHFSLDAQTIVLEDYLEIRPDWRERLEDYIRAGRIAVGPWYQLNDEFLVSGEATVRSLLVGHRIAQSFGGVMKVGYLPDQFGNISQMPQILRGFGIDNAIMGRGRQLADDSKMEFWWEAPDGSRVLGSLMAYWYNNAQYIPADPDGAAAFLTKLRDAMAARSASSHLLMMNGVDHLEPQPWIGKTLEAAAELVHARTGDELRHSTLSDYVCALREEIARNPSALETVVGELRDDRGGACLAGTLSTRVYLKQANDAAQTALERYAEPLSAFARLEGVAYPADELRYAWKLLMQNHPHDSICGCSVDAVHEEMMTRFGKVRQLADALIEEAADAITARDRTAGAMALPCDLYVFNTLNWRRTDPVRAVIAIPLGPPSRGNAQRSAEAIIRGLRIVAPDGSEMPYELLSNEVVLNTVTNPLELPLDQWVQRLEVSFVASDVPPCGYTVYRLEAAPHWYAGPTMREDPEACPIEIQLEDVGDAGDEYLYKPPLRDVRVVVGLNEVQTWAEERTAVRTSRIVRHDLRVPRYSTADARSEELVSCPVHIRHTKWVGVPRHEFQLDVQNAATDHRLRLLVEAGGTAVVAGSPFDAVVRSPRPATEQDGASPFMPFSLWVATSAEDGRGTLAVIAPGLHEYEAYTDGTGRVRHLGVTLLRCVGQLSGRGDGPGLATPGAQCLGSHRFEIAVLETQGAWDESEVWKQAHQFAAPLLAIQAPIRAVSQRRVSYIEVSPSALVVTAVKRCEDRDSLIVRCYNTTDKLIRDAEMAVPKANAWRQVTLNEEPESDWHEGSSAKLDVRPKGIVTLEFRL